MRRTLFALLIILAFPLWAQSDSDEKLSYVGMTLADLFDSFGVPKTVLAARGNEYWQDDVVFQYNEGDFFIHRDRVWQVMLPAACGIANRDRKAAVLLTLGNSAQDRGDHVLFPISGKGWPLMLRVNISNSGQVSAIYIYRPDY
jgi:hypothetical protein